MPSRLVEIWREEGELLKEMEQHEELSIELPDEDELMGELIAGIYAFQAEESWLAQRRSDPQLLILEQFRLNFVSHEEALDTLSDAWKHWFKKNHTKLSLRDEFGLHLKVDNNVKKLVPRKLRMELVSKAYAMGHSSEGRTLRNLQLYNIWPAMSKESGFVIHA